MICLIILLILAAIYFYELRKASPNSEELVVKSTLLIVFIIIFGIFATVVSYRNISLKTTLVRISRDIEVSTQRFEAISSTLVEYAKEYPLEEELLKNFNPIILLKLPEIKSDEIVIEQINLAIEYQDKIFELQLLENEKKAKIDYYRHWLFFPSFYYANYEKDEI